MVPRNAHRQLGNCWEVYTNICGPGFGCNILEWLARFRLADLVELILRDSELSQDLEKQRRTYLTATMKWDRNGTTVRVVPPFVAANLAGSRESKLPRAAFWNSRAVALGMDDFCRVRWKRETFFFVLLENHPKNAVEFFQRLLTGGHQRVTTGNGENFGNPGAVFLPVKNDLVVFETHFVSQLLN